MAGGFGDSGYVGRQICFRASRPRFSTGNLYPSALLLLVTACKSSKRLIGPRVIEIDSLQVSFELDDTWA